MPVVGDLSQPALGVSDESTRPSSGQHRPLLPSRGDLRHDRRRREPEGGEHRRAPATPSSWPRRSSAGTFHMVSSIAAAGLYRGTWREDMFEEAEDLDTHPYFRTKHESERVVREECDVPWRVYRPGIVVGDSETGEMDKVDGPYYFFKLIQRIRAAVPQWVPMLGVEGREINIVPVDFVVEGDGPHRPRRGARRQGVPPDRPEPEVRRRGDRHLRRGGQRALAPPPASPPVRSRPWRRWRSSASARCRRSRWGSTRSSATSASRGRSSSTSTTRPASTTGRRARRWPGPTSACRRWRRTRTSSGTTGSATSTPTSTGTRRWSGRCGAGRGWSAASTSSSASRSPTS